MTTPVERHLCSVASCAYKQLPCRGDDPSERTFGQDAPPTALLPQRPTYKSLRCRLVHLVSPLRPHKPHQHSPDISPLSSARVDRRSAGKRKIRNASQLNDFPRSRPAGQHRSIAVRIEDHDILRHASQWLPRARPSRTPLSSQIIVDIGHMDSQRGNSETGGCGKSKASRAQIRQCVRCQRTLLLISRKARLRPALGSRRRAPFSPSLD